MFEGPDPNDIENWVCVMERSNEYEVELARGFLSSRNIPSNIQSKRDTAFSLNVGEMSLVYLYVPEEFEKKARKALAEWEASDSKEADDS